jgi:hypothetical protein
MTKLESEGFIRGSVKSVFSAYLEVDHESAQAFIATEGKRILLQFKQGSSYHRALQLRKDGYALVALSKAVLKNQGFEIGDKVWFSLSKDDSEYGMPFSLFFKEVLSQDKAANIEFEKLTIGRQRGLLHYIDSAKTEETELKRSVEIAEKLKTDGLYKG